MAVGVPEDDQRTSHGASVAEHTQDTEQTGAAAGELCPGDGEGQDRYEVEIIYEGEDEIATLRKHYKSCRESARHPEYIPVSGLCMDHLPQQYRTERVLALVKAQVKLTVLLKVGTIDRRAEYFLGTDKKATRQGSGRVVKVKTYQSEWDKDEECPCEECRRSEKPRQSYAEIEVHTAAHLVFDEIEGRNTACYFDFDGASTGLCRTLSTAVLVEGNADDDVSKLTFVTHDIKFARQLEETVTTQKRLFEEIRRELRVEIGYDDSEKNLLDCHEWSERDSRITGAWK